MTESRAESMSFEQIQIAENGCALQFKVRAGTDDADIVREAATAQYYRDGRALLAPDSTVIDVGAHIGGFSLWAACQGARVRAFEPVPDNYALLEENIRINHLESRVKAFNVAIWSSAIEKTMHVTSENTGGSSLCYGKESDPQVAVHCARLDDVMAAEGIPTCDWLKLECEGAEFDILPSMDQATWQRIQAVVLEYHTLAGPDRSGAQLERRFAGQHFLISSEPAEIPGLGYLLAAQPPFAFTPFHRLSIALEESPQTRLSLAGRLWRAIRRPAHQLVVYYFNQMIAQADHRQRQTAVYLNLIAKRSQSHTDDNNKM